MKPGYNDMLFHLHNGDEDPHAICIVQPVRDEAPGESQILMRTGIIIQYNNLFTVFQWESKTTHCLRPPAPP